MHDRDTAPGPALPANMRRFTQEERSHVDEQKDVSENSRCCRRGRCNRGRTGDRAGPAGDDVALPVDVERRGTDLQVLRGFLRACQGGVERQAGHPAFRRRRGDRTVRDARRVDCGRAAGAFVMARLLDRQGRRPGGDRRLRVRLPAPLAGRGLVLSQGRPADAAPGLRQVQRLSGRRELVGRRIDRVEKADRENGGLQGREIPLAAGHDRGNPHQARRLDRRAAGGRGVFGARQGCGRRRRLGHAVDEPAHGVPRDCQVSDQAVSFDAGAGVHGQLGCVEETA